MADADPVAIAAEAPPPRPLPRRVASGFAKAVVAAALALLLAAAAFLAFLDTAPGHRFIADKIADMAPRSGLKIVIGRIEGSIYGRTKLRNVRLYDPQGQFAEIPYMEMDWQPLAWITNRLLIHDLHSKLVYLDRLPKLIPAEEPQPILPGFDIHIGRLEIEQLRLGKAVTGREQIASVSGEADIRAGRALVELDGAVRGSGERIAIRLDAEPDRNRFDVEARVAAPQGSVIGALIGTSRPLQLQVTGDGSWARWAGTARLNLSGRRTADLALVAENGRYGLSGSLAVSQFWQGKKQRLTMPRVLVNGRATLEDRLLDGRLSLRSSALRVETRGGIEPGQEPLRGCADRRRPAAAAGAFPEHDRATRAADYAAQWPLRSRRFRLSGHFAQSGIRPDRI